MISLPNSDTFTSSGVNWLAMGVVIVLAMVMVATVSWARWYTDGTADCSNCDPE